MHSRKSQADGRSEPKNGQSQATVLRNDISETRKEIQTSNK